MSTQSPAAVVSVSDEMRTTARSIEPDRYLAALRAPRAIRDDLVVLAAFVGELKRIPQIASDPHLAEIRLAWWRDALVPSEAAPSGNPTADAMRSVIERHKLDREALTVWLDAFAHTFYAAAPEDEAHLDLEYSLIEGTPFYFAARICGGRDGEALKAACNAAGIAYGLARLGLDFPRVLARGRVPLPGLEAAGSDPAAVTPQAARARLSALGNARLDRVRPMLAKLDKPTRTALLPLALVEPYLQASCNQGHDLMRELAEVAPLTRVWRIWRASIGGRV